MSYYPYGYGYGYPYGYGYGYPYYSLPLLSSEYKLNGLYNELDELNELEANNALLMNREAKFDMSMNSGLHNQLKKKNHELVQHIVGKNKEIGELRELLKKNNIDEPAMDCSMNTRYFWPRPHRYHHHPHPHPYPYPYPYRHRDEVSETHTIVPRAIAPGTHPGHYVIPSHVHILPCVLPPSPPNP
jgi:hypothetical protein